MLNAYKTRLDRSLVTHRAYLGRVLVCDNQTLQTFLFGKSQTTYVCKGEETL